MDYPNRILTAKARRPIYYVDSSSKIKGRTVIPPSYLNIDKYYFKEGILHSKKTGCPQLANPTLAGQPRYWVVNFQDIWNQSLAKQQRAMMVDKLKDILRPYIKTLVPLTQFPIEISLIIFDEACPVDISNKGVIYTKVIEDLLVKEGIIPDDSVQYVNCSGRTKFILVEKSQKKMEIHITKSDIYPYAEYQLPTD